MRMEKDRGEHVVTIFHLWRRGREQRSIIFVDLLFSPFSLYLQVHFFSEAEHVLLEIPVENAGVLWL
jgi:hypothetical protein